MATNCTSILDTEKFVGDLDEIVSLRYYLYSLMHALWTEGEGFSGKRPFGHSGWDQDVYGFLIASGELQGNLDQYGSPENFDKIRANELMSEVLEDLFGV